VGIANKDTGDDAGDLFFTLLSATKASECDKPNPPVRRPAPLHLRSSFCLCTI
jgi:hypothetical protein